MIKPYPKPKSANAALVAFAANSTSATNVVDVKPVIGAKTPYGGELISEFENIESRIAALAERLDCLACKLRPLLPDNLKVDYDADDEYNSPTFNWDISLVGGSERATTPFTRRLEVADKRIVHIINGINELINTMAL